ncbi:MAG: class I SAM-dependent methyltransferase [Anaerolineaceae bacterium]|nr:class I SAM-dependent methyltransferase [Anaerolineaceae bacterium]
MSHIGHQEGNQDPQQYWDSAAASFDDAPDHGLRDPLIRQAWTELIQAWLPPSPISILDIGCGTGSLSLILAQPGNEVTGIDLSPKMISLVQAKAAEHSQPILFQVMDGADPCFPKHHFDLLLCRHLLWALPEPGQVLQRWAKLLKPGGRLILIEGFWHTGAGLHARQIIEALPPTLTQISNQNLSAQPDLWGGTVADERYAILAAG